MVMHACNPGAAETEAGGLGGQGYPRLPSEFEGRWLHKEICIQKN